MSIDRTDSHVFRLSAGSRRHDDDRSHPGGGLVVAGSTPAGTLYWLPRCQCPHCAAAQSPSPCCDDKDACDACLPLCTAVFRVAAAVFELGASSLSLIAIPLSPASIVPILSIVSNNLLGLGFALTPNSCSTQSCCLPVELSSFLGALIATLSLLSRLPAVVAIAGLGVFFGGVLQALCMVQVCMPLVFCLPHSRVTCLSCPATLLQSTLEQLLPSLREINALVAALPLDALSLGG